MDEMEKLTELFQLAGLKKELIVYLLHPLWIHRCKVVREGEKPKKWMVIEVGKSMERFYNWKEDQKLTLNNHM
jgi:hypothetical protein